MSSQDFSRDRIESNVPAELKRRRQWVAYQLLRREGDKKPRKVPIDPTNGQPAAVDDMATWGAFDEALAAVAHWNLAGVGYVFSSADPYCGIDLDGVVATNADGSVSVASWAEQLLVRIKTVAYVETSPSGTGVHAIFRGKLPLGHKKKVSYPDGTGAEAYESNRFFTVTGAARFPSPHVLPDATNALPTICEWLRLLETRGSGERRAESSADEEEWSNGFTDDEAIDRARKAKNGDKFAKLFDRGDLSDYEGDKSRGDMALVAMIAFWTGPNREQIDRIFRRSKLYRDKWDRDDYRERTIDAALYDKGSEDFFRRYEDGQSGSTAKDEPNGDRFAPRWDDDIENAPAPQYLVKDWLVEQTIAALYGQPGSFKTSTAIDLGLCTGMGFDWHGCTVQRGTVAYAAAEGAAGLGMRVKAWKKHRGVVGRANVGFFFQEANFLIDKDVVDFIAALTNLPSAPKLVVIDTLAWAMAGGDENAVKDVMKVLSGARRVRDEFGATVLILHHTGKNGETERGSSALRAGCDTMLKQTVERGVVTLEADKQRDAPKAKPRRFRPKTILLGEPSGDDDAMTLDLSSSYVLVDAAEAADRDDPGADREQDGAFGYPLTPTERAVLRVLQRLNAVDGPVTLSRWIETLESEPESRSKSTVNRVRLSALERGFVIKVGRLYQITPEGEAAVAWTPFNRREGEQHAAD